MLSEKLNSFIQNPSIIMDLAMPLLGKIALALAIFLIGRWIGMRLIKLLNKVMESNNVDPTLRNFFTTILTVAVNFMVALAAVAKLGVNTTSFLAMLGAAGLAVGLALQNSLSNFAAGIMLILFRPFKAGDYVEGGGVQGTAETISIFSTTFRTPDNKTIVVPNNLIYAGNIINYTERERRRVDLVIRISYNDNIKQARDLVMGLLDKDERILKDPEPMIVVGELSESSIDLLIRPWVETNDYWTVRWDLLELIKETFDANNITIPFPQRDLNVRSRELASQVV